ncbi:PAS domain S-box-containing protein [Polaromonas sp. CG_9.5]|uniref:sensor histidine kinase n=1 Tax=Polaromonas sp. CG_9.5 TaxID=3071705 RepID=UPI002DF87223|nr:PAS domain S-box-containing protein [Polaromonas sp. CG_9.5]
MKTFLDVKKAEDSDTHFERALLQRAIASSKNGITIGRSSQGKFPLIYANAAFYDMTGYGPEEVIGKNCSFLQNGENDQPGLHTIRAAMAQGTDATVLLRNYRKDGSAFWNELTVSPVFNEHRVLTHYIGIQSDVTERENNAQAIASLNIALTRRGEELALANESLRSFSSSASHDLRAPLASINGFCVALKKSANFAEDSRSAHYLARIEANTQRMKELVESLLTLAQSTATPLRLAFCDLSLMAQEVIDTFEAASAGLLAKVSIEPGLTAWGDPSLLRLVLQNLLGNALKYSSRTPHARVHFGRAPSNEGTTRFFVRDNGAGFDAHNAAALFSPFQRFHAESDYPGNGVGLATVHRIVARHGGTVSAKSEPGEGAVFYFSLGPGCAPA